MEKKLPDDNLEEFLRNSFDRYNESPSDSVWDRIDTSLATPPVRKSPVLKKLLYPVAATVLLTAISFLIYSNYKLRSKLNVALAGLENVSAPDSNTKSETVLLNDKLTSTLNTSEPFIPSEIGKTIEKINENSEENKIRVRDSKQTYTSKSTDSNTAVHSKNKLIGKSVGKINDHLTNAGQIEINNRLEINDDPGFKTEITSSLSKKKRSNILKKAAGQEFKIKPEKDSESKEYTVKDNTSIKQNEILFPDATIIKNDQNGIAESNFMSAMDKFNISSLPVRFFELSANINASRFSTVNTSSLPFVPNRAINTSEIAVMAGKYHESGKIENERSSPHGPLNLGKRTNEYSTPDSWQMGISLNKAISKNWFFTSGIGFKQFNIINEINQSVPFGNRKPKPGGMPFQHDFDFKIKCNAGSSDIVIKSEQLDQRASYTDNQPIEINVKTKFELNYLSVPVGFQYRFVKNRFFAGLGIGLNMDVLTRGTMSAPEVKILNNILKPIEQPSLNRLGQTKDVVFNSKANLLLGYSINKNFKLMIAPELYLPLSNRTPDRDGTIDTNAWGIQAGIAYNLN